LSEQCHRFTNYHITNLDQTIFMKKRILLFSSSIVLLSGLIMSYNAGPGSPGGQNRTGATIAGSSCSGGGCHTGTGSYTNTGLNVSLTSGITPVSAWKPDSVYTVIITGGTTAPKYGFQLTSAWDNAGTNVPAGTFSGATGTTHIATVSGYSIFEHGNAQTPIAGQFVKTATWTAPSSGTVDTVDFYLTVNNVNGTGSTDGDKSNNVKISIGKVNPAAVGTLNADIKIAAYPNPVTDKLNISLENAENGTYTIRVFDMNGKVVANHYANVNKSFSTTINTAAWANGMYHVQLQKDGAQRTIAVVKQ
jgi:hypothetical protein